MSRIAPLIIVGFTLFLGGLYWMVWDDSTSYLNSIIIQNEYYEFASFIWRMIPAVLLIVGLLCIILAGIRSFRNTEVYR